jgi:hypothetical protein
LPETKLEAMQDAGCLIYISVVCEIWVRGSDVLGAEFCGDRGQDGDEFAATDLDEHAWLCGMGSRSAAGWRGCVTEVPWARHRTRLFFLERGLT